MNWILGIDTSSTELGIGLANNGRCIAGFSRYVRYSHAELIAEGIEFILKTAKIGPADIDTIAIATGPGSFTGLRIGIAFVKGFCLEPPVRILPVSSLESVAIGSNIHHQPIVIAFDARRDTIFWARFHSNGHRILRKTEDACAPAKEFQSIVSKEDIVITDTLGYTKSSVFDFLKERPQAYSIDQYPVQRGLACARKGMQSCDNESWISVEELTPRYLSKAYAEA
ncbi:MAG: tRNA (adenosine(37)-N6)-threonylcarbamoyltransferase complex dimerization subunit type 1 TsaB [Chitinivibrionales bacterium]|nr:tRNA (adenosine(37)-N6)-threonylcarbamoyltransferase complex dimerization subunit type 1 TsaB [Chitinivibrionales bacterium]